MSGWGEAKKSPKVSDISSKWPQSYDEDDGSKKSKLTFRQTVILNEQYDFIVSSIVGFTLNLSCNSCPQTRDGSGDIKPMLFIEISKVIVMNANVYN